MVAIKEEQITTFANLTKGKMSTIFDRTLYNFANNKFYEVDRNICIDLLQQLTKISSSNIYLFLLNPLTS